MGWMGVVTMVMGWMGCHSNDHAIAQPARDTPADDGYIYINQSSQFSGNQIIEPTAAQIAEFASQPIARDIVLITHDMMAVVDFIGAGYSKNDCKMILMAMKGELPGGDA